MTTSDDSMTRTTVRLISSIMMSHLSVHLPVNIHTFILRSTSSGSSTVKTKTKFEITLWCSHLG